MNPLESMDCRVKTNDFKLMAKSGTRTNGYYLDINHFRLKITRWFLTIRAGRFYSNFLKEGDLVKYWAVYYKQMTIWKGLQNVVFVTACLVPLFLISENKLIWVNALFYSTPICSVFLNKITPISVTSRITNRQWPRSVDLSSEAHSCLAFWSNRQEFSLNSQQNCKTLAIKAVAAVCFIFSFCLQHFHTTWILNFLKKISFLLAKCWCLKVKAIKKEIFKIFWNIKVSGKSFYKSSVLLHQRCSFAVVLEKLSLVSFLCNNYFVVPCCYVNYLTK